MARQRDWDSLSPRTRKSYIGTGANQLGWTPGQVRAHYESGGNLKDLRRHTHTPERPEQATRNPTAYPGYQRSGGKAMRVVARESTSSRVKTVEHLSKSERSLIGQYRYALERYLSEGATNDYTNADGKRVRGLDYFTGKKVNGVELETRTGALEDMWARHELDDFLQSIY